MPDHDESYRRFIEGQIATAIARSNEQHNDIVQNFASQNGVLAEIRTEVKATNGRVRSLEKAVAVLQFAYLVGAAVVGAGFTALLVDWISRRY